MATFRHRKHVKSIFGSELNLYPHFYPYHSFTIFITFTLTFTFPQHLPLFYLHLHIYLCTSSLVLNSPYLFCLFFYFSFLCLFVYFLFFCLFFYFSFFSLFFYFSFFVQSISFITVVILVFLEIDP